MNGQNQKVQTAQPKPLPVKFVHEEGAAFRTLPADGVWGMLNNQGNIQLNFFTEHAPIPHAVIFPVSEGGSFSGPPSEQYKDNDPAHYIVIREFQVGVTMSLHAAKHTHMVLGNFIAMAEDQLRSAAQSPLQTNKPQ
ncbi:MAG: hypothetical protein ACLQVY_11505 [Limisphaerales bacterium]